MAAQREAPQPLDGNADLTRTVVLLDQARAGDTSARDRLIRRVAPQVHALVRRRMGARLRARAESVDMAQSVLAEAVRHMNGFRPDGDGALLRWLARMVENRLRREARAMQYGDRAPECVRPMGLGDAGSAGTNEPVFEPGAQGPTPSVRVEVEEQRRRVLELVERLPERERILVRLKRLEGLDWPEILERSGETNLKAARNAYSRGMSRLASWMLHD